MTSGPPVGDARRAAVRGALAGAVVGAAAVGAVGAAAASAAAYFARQVVTPVSRRPDDVQIVAVGAGSVTLLANPITAAPGRYGAWLQRGGGHARFGDVLHHDDRTVTRTVLAVDGGRLLPGPARWNQYYFAGDPAAALGLSYQDVGIDTDLGPMPAWLVPAQPDRPVADQDAARWAILVHGRGATREECLRALPVLHRLGYTSLVVSYRNDAGAPRSPGGRYHLGDLEWRDVEAAVRWATAAGAVEVVLVGWSMGGSIALQVVSRSTQADTVRGLVLDAPVLDWRSVFSHNARVHRLPQSVSRLSLRLLAHPLARRITGVEDPVDLDRLDWVTRAEQLRLPVLVLHSEDDDVVPAEPSRLFAAARPDLVTYVPSRGALHTKEWNVDPDGWDAAVARFLLGL